MTETNLQPGRKSTATNVILKLGGLIDFHMDLYTAARSGKATDGAMKMVCTEPHLIGVTAKGKSVYGPALVTQRYVCNEHPDPGGALAAAVNAALREDAGEGPLRDALQAQLEHFHNEVHGPFEPWELGRAREVDGAWVSASKEEIVAAKVGDMEKEIIELSVHPASELDSVTRPGEKTYLLRPSKGKAKTISSAGEKSYATLRRLVTDRPDLAFVGSLRLRDSRHVYRLGLWDGQLVLSELVLPADLQGRDVIGGEADEATVDRLVKLADSFVEPFDETKHGWDVEAAVKTLLEAAKDTQVVAEPVEVIVDHDIDAMIARVMG